jgi:hypothetical protein
MFTWTFFLPSPCNSAAILQRPTAEAALLFVLVAELQGKKK